MTLKIGQKAPNFTLQTETGAKVSLDGLRGKKIVLFFYPKDDTPGCTKESCEFRDHLAAFEKKGAQVFGISADDSTSHKNFKNKYNLNFPLLADPDHRVCTDYGVWGMQEWKDKKFEGIARTTFVIDEAGAIKRIYEKVNPEGHAEKVLNEL